jgi:hypothetical protein
MDFSLFFSSTAPGLVSLHNFIFGVRLFLQPARRLIIIISGDVIKTFSRQFKL